MLDIKKIKAEQAEVERMLSTRGEQVNLAPLVEMYDAMLYKKQQLEDMQRSMNDASGSIGKIIKDGGNATEAKAKMKQLSATIKEAEPEVRELEAALRDAMLLLPNIPHDSVPEGADEDENVEIRKWGEPRKFNFEAKTHIEIGESLGILDFKRAAKLSGARFVIYHGAGAKLERALAAFMLNSHGRNGYEEVMTPYIVTAETMTGTGQLPKFEEDLFKLQNDMYLIPTAEVPVTNIYAGEVLKNEELPKKFTAYTPCFRSEAGSYGKVSAGLIRQHQFNKVEMVQLVRPEEGMETLEQLTADAEAILQALDLPYRVLELCTGDIGFSSAKTYDLEVWLPSQGKYVEISSCSLFTDFQARRAAIRFKREAGGKPEFVNTINGSGLAIGRTVVAILENCQNEDGTVTIPKALRHYMYDQDKIE